MTVKKTISHYTSPLEYRERVIEDTRALGGQRGYGQFISHTVLQRLLMILSLMITEYVIDYKSW